ncbi:MAG: hypothetical protein ACXWPM_00945 [Bdellovibrionota bacterium]
MFQRFSFIPVVFCLMAALAWWSSRVSVSSDLEVTASGLPASVTVEHRQDLVEALEKIVSYEHYYRTVYGHFTKILSRTGFMVPEYLAGIYDIRVAEASADRLLVTAISETEGKKFDLASMDQLFQLHSNFEIPPPHLEHLRAHAFKRLRELRDSGGTAVAEEASLHSGYFRYEIQSDSKDQATGRAIGIRAPVLGLQLEIGSRGTEAVAIGDAGMELLTALPDEATLTSRVESSLGQHPGSNLPSSSLQEEAFLAQQIFRGETGRYARDWSELSRVANFRFEGKDQLGLEQLDREAPRAIRQEPDRKLSSSDNPRMDSQRLEIEALDSEELK